MKQDATRAMPATPMSWLPRERLPLVGLLLAAVILGALLGKMPSPTVLVALAALVGVALLLVLRLDATLGAVVVAAAIIMDYFRLLSVSYGFPLFSMTLMLLLIAVFYLFQSAERPWVPTRSLWLWGLLCALVALAIPRSTVLVDALRYWLMVYVNGALAYVIGTQIVREFKQFRRLLIALAVFGVGMGLHAIIFAFTGHFLLQSELIRNWLAVRSNYLIPGTHLPRVTSFLLNPDNFGGIMEMFLPILLALGFSNATWRWRAVAFAGAGVIAIGLLFSYSTAAFVGAAAAMVVFGLLALQPKYRAYFVGLLVAAPLIAGVVFESHLNAFIEHATAPRELSLRLADWQTGLNIILHLPLTGIGIGGANYMAKEDPFRVPMQNIPLEHPHNSFLEIGAMVGLPALLVFALLLGLCLWRALRHYERADMKQRVLIGAVIAAMVSLSVNSLATTGWTLPPASVLAWMLLGAVTSPRLLWASAAPSASHDQASVSGAPTPAIPATGERTSAAVQEQT